MHTIESLRTEFKTLAKAKAALGLKAASWKALAEKANGPEALVQQLRQENEMLRQLVAELQGRGGQFDPIGFWLQDGNFDRSRFPDFGVPEEAFHKQSVAKAFHKQLARQYHPDKGGTAEQMANLNRLLDQVLALVEMNDGMGA
jgi:hypothetical protein